MIHNDDRLARTVFFVNANSFEQFSLWKEHKDVWEEDVSEFSQIIGYINDHHNMPVNVSFSFAKIHGQLVCFYYTCSRFNDHEMVEAWICEHYPIYNGTRRAMTNATNFHHCTHLCKEIALTKGF